MFRNVCRLCLDKDDLIWIFNDKMADNMNEIIHATSGVEITKKDPITQMVCNTCCQITIKMYKFRTTSIKNDKDLKAQYADYNICQLAQSNYATSVPPPSNQIAATFTDEPSKNLPHITIKSNNLLKKLPQIKVKCEDPLKNLPQVTIKSDNPLKKSPQIAPKSDVKPLPARYRFAHPSVKEVVKKYPGINIPDNCLKSHVGAYITLLTEEVDDWFRERNFTDKEIEKLKKEALEPTKKKKSAPQSQKRPRNDLIHSVAKKSKIDSSKKVKADQSENDRSLSPTNVLNRKKMISTNPLKSKAKTDTEKSTKKEIKPKNKPSSSGEATPKNKNTKLEVDCSNESSASNLSAMLNNMLDSKHDSSNISKREEITLTSILQTRKDDRKKQKFSNVVENNVEFQSSPTSPSDKTDQLSKENNSTCKSPILEDYEWFTSRPFLKDPKEPSEPLVLSDSDDENNQSTDKTDKTIFTEALNLAPTADLTNSPDLSLLSIAKKPVQLYTCKVCDSQQYSAKDLKVHMKRRHMKCPFCGKRFNTLELREEHVSACRINAKTIKTKEIKLSLVRVDEIDELKKKHAGAFERFEEDVREEEHVNVENIEKDKELENILSCQEVLNEAVSDGDNDVICISDDETEADETGNKMLENDSNRRITVVGSEMLRNIDTHASDLDVLRKILRNSTQIKSKKIENTASVLNLKDNPIIDHSSPRMKIFKNLLHHLMRYKIPIEVECSSVLSVEYKPTKSPPLYRMHDLWGVMKPVDIKSPSVLQQHIQEPVNKSNKVTVFNGQSNKTVNPNQTNTTIVLNTLQNNATTAANLMLNNSITTSSMVLNGTSNLNTADDVAKYILVPNNLLPQAQQSALPSQQGPLPVIQSVTSLQTNSDQPSAAVVANLESITNSLMPNSTTTASTTMYLPVSGTSNTVFAVTNVVQPNIVNSVDQSTAQQPGIRVKNLSELS